MGFGVKNKIENQPFVGKWDGDYSEDESASLQVGAECLSRFRGDAKKAISEYPDHATEIVLTSIFNLLAIDEPLNQVFGHVLHLIESNDTVNFNFQAH